MEQRLAVVLLQEQGRVLVIVLRQGLELAPSQRLERVLLRVLG
jgi:hypothetical protein